MTASLVARVSRDLGLPESVVVRISNSAAKRYKRFRIPKRGSTEFRAVAQPAREVKAVQRSIVRALKGSIPVHPAATAYETGSSILKNALAHRHAKYLLKLDFSSFFPSIGEADVDAHLRKHIDDPDVEESIRFVTRACLWRDTPAHQPGLCIGAPSSPFLANSIMFGFDEFALSQLGEIGAVYTRYSDDITVSAVEEHVVGRAEDMLRDIARTIEYPRLSFNDAKRVSVGRGCAFRVTGLTLTNDGAVSVGRSRKRGVRAGMDRFRAGLLSDEESVRLRGELSFVLSVEPEYEAVLRRVYGDGAFFRLARFSI